MPGKMVDFPSNGGTTQGYLATPTSGKGAGVLVIQEWWGLVPHIKRVCDRFAAEGFSALAPDMYHGKTADEVAAAIKKAGKPSEIHIYPNVDHAFFNEDNTGAYNKAAADDAWRRTTTFFRQHLK